MRPQQTPHAEVEVVGGGAAVEEVGAAAPARAAGQPRYLEVERLGDADGLGVYERRLGVVGLVAPVDAVDAQGVLFLLRSLYDAHPHRVLGVRLEDRGRGVAVDGGAEDVGRVRRLAVSLLAQHERLGAVVDAHDPRVVVGELLGRFWSLYRAVGGARVAAGLCERDEVLHGDAELAEVVVSGGSDHVHRRPRRVAGAAIAAGVSMGGIVYRLVVISGLRVAEVVALRLDDERPEVASVLVHRREVVVVSEDRSQLVVGVPALVDGLPRSRAGLRTRVPVGRVFEAAAVPVAALLACGDPLVEVGLFLAEGGLLVVPAVGGAVGGEHVELNEVDVAADHVGLGQLDEGVAAEPVGQAVGEVEVDAVSGVDPDEERLGLLLSGEDGVGVLGRDHDAALRVVPAFPVVLYVGLYDAHVVCDLARSRRTRLREWRAGVRALSGVARHHLLFEGELVREVLLDRVGGVEAGCVEHLAGDHAAGGGEILALDGAGVVLVAVGLADAVRGLRRAPAVLAGYEARVARVVGGRPGRGLGARQRFQVADVHAVGGLARAVLAHVVDAQQRPEAFREVRVEVTVEDGVAERAGLAARSEEQVGGERLAGAVGLGVYGLGLGAVLVGRLSGGLAGGSGVSGLD